MVYTVDAKGITDDVAARFGIPKGELFNLTVYENPGTGAIERFLNVTVTTTAGSRRLDRVLAEESSLVRVKLKADGTPDLIGARPTDSKPDEDPSDPKADKAKFKNFSGGVDSDPLTTDTDVLDESKRPAYSLAKPISSICCASAGHAQ